MPARRATSSSEVRSQPFSPITAAAASISRARVRTRLSPFGRRRRFVELFAISERKYTGVYFIHVCIKLRNSSMPRAAPIAQRAPPSDDEIPALLADQIDAQHKSVGMVIGIITPEGRRVASRGSTSERDGRPVDGDTAFEIASVHKVFTALLLTDM